MKHLLVISTRYPNDVAPLSGIAVARSVTAMAKMSADQGTRRTRPDGASDWRISVINPIGLPALSPGLYRELSRLDGIERDGDITTFRPRHTQIAKPGTRRDAAAIASSAVSLAKEIHANVPVDLVSAEHAFPDGPAGAQVAGTLGVPLVISARGRDFVGFVEKDFARAQIMDAFDQASAAMVPSQALKRVMASHGISPQRITVIQPGLDRDRFRPLDHTRLRAQLVEPLGFAMPDNAPLLVCVGTLCERNGQDLAIAASAQVEGARLILVGEGEDERHLRELSDDLGLSDRIHFAGSLDHDMLPLVLSAADAMVLACAIEGFANVWIEAIGCGTPVVAIDTPAAREVIENDTAGRLVKRDTDSIAAGINALLNDPPLQRDVAALATRFGWERHAAERMALYDRVLAGSPH